MRVGTLRWLSLAAMVVAFAAVAGAAPPMAEPKPPEGKPDAKNGETSTTEQRAKLQNDLLQLIKKVNNLPTQPPQKPVAPRPKPVEPFDGSKVSAIKEGINLFRDEKFDAARLTFKEIDPATLDKEDRAFVQYMHACSCRRVGRISEAEALYREVANSQDDEFFADCAKWQLSLIRSEQELQAQLEQLRSRAKTK